MSGDRGWVNARIVVEVVLLVGSVLIAFQVDRWWQDRDTAEREAALLAGLRVDTEVNLERVGQVLGLQLGLLESQRALLREIHDGRTGISFDSLRMLITESRRFHRLEPVTGAYEALVASGDLRLIRSDELRSTLTRFFEEAARGYEDEGLSTLYRVELTRAIVAETEYLGAMPPARRAFYDMPQSRYPFEAERLLDSPEFSSYLTLLLRTESSQTNYFTALQLLGKELRTLLEAELQSVGGGRQ
jgi:hypothetical protein